MTSDLDFTNSVNFICFGLQMQARALQQCDIEAIIAEHADMLGAIVDTMPSYDVNDHDLAVLVTKILTKVPGVMDSILKRGVCRSGDTGEEKPLGKISAALALYPVAQLTVALHGDALLPMIVGAIAPTSSFLSAARH